MSYDVAIDDTYHLKLLEPEEFPIWVPGLTHWYVRGAQMPEAYTPIVNWHLMECQIFLFQREKDTLGFIAFEDVGVRDTAEIHFAFWRPSTFGRRREAIITAMRSVMQQHDLLRIEAYIDPAREDLCQFAEACGGQFVGTVPSCRIGPDGRPGPRQYYVLPREENQ